MKELPEIIAAWKQLKQTEQTAVATLAKQLNALSVIEQYLSTRQAGAVATAIGLRFLLLL